MLLKLPIIYKKMNNILIKLKIHIHMGNILFNTPFITFQQVFQVSKIVLYFDINAKKKNVKTKQS